MTFSKGAWVVGAIRTRFHAFPDGGRTKTQPSPPWYASGVRKEIPIPDHLSGSTLGHAPTVAQGWGRVNLDRLFRGDTTWLPILAFDQDTHVFSSGGQPWQKQIEVAVPGEDLIVVLVYTDRYSEPPASSLKVNDLDLQVAKFTFSGKGPTFWGNRFYQGQWYSKDYSQLPPEWTAIKDQHNTVEVVRVPNAGSVFPDWFTVEVRGTTVNAAAIPDPGNPNPPPSQDFALFIVNAVLH